MPNQITKAPNGGTSTQGTTNTQSKNNQTIKAKQTPITATRGKTVQAKQSTHKATRGSVVQRKNAPSKDERWTFSQFEKAYNTPVDLSELTAEEKKYFDTYEKRAQVYLDRSGSKWGGKTKITGSMFANAARWSYLHYSKDMSKVVPVEFALAQAQFESHLGMTGRSASKNPFNIGEYNDSTASFVSKIDDGDMGVAMYYHLMAEDYLSARTSDELLENFINERGQRYQVDDGGVSDKSYEADVKKQMGFINRFADKHAGKQTTSTKPTSTKDGTITASALNVRKGAGVNFSVAGDAIKKGEKITVLESKNGWYRIGDNRWVSAKYVSLAKTQENKPVAPKPKQGVVTASALNIRKGAGSNFGKNGNAIKSGTEITILETQNGWHRIGENRWVSAKHVSLTKTEQQTPKEIAEKPKKGTSSVPTSANFKITEFDCNDGTAVPPKYYTNVQNLMKQLEVLRSELGSSISINSAYRPSKYNKAVGGGSNSQHLYAKASDIVVKGYTPKQVHAKIEELTKAGKMTQGGLGLYKTFVHYDIRGTKARWDFS